MKIYASSIRRGVAGQALIYEIHKKSNGLKKVSISGSILMSVKGTGFGTNVLGETIARISLRAHLVLLMKCECFRWWQMLTGQPLGELFGVDLSPKNRSIWRNRFTVGPILGSPSQRESLICCDQFAERDVYKR